MATHRTVTVKVSMSLEVEATCTVYPPFSGRGERGFSLGEPPEPAHADITTLKSPLGVDLSSVIDELEREVREEIEAAAIAAAGDREESDREAAAEAAEDARREEAIYGGFPLYGEED